MVAIDQTSSPEVSQAEVLAASRRLMQEALVVLPGALALVGFHLFLVARALSRLSPVEGIVVCGATIWICASAVYLLFVLRGARMAHGHGRPHLVRQRIEALRLSLAGTTAALLVGATADIALAIEVTTHSWSPAAVAAAMFVALACRICW